MTMRYFPLGEARRGCAGLPVAVVAPALTGACRRARRGGAAIADRIASGEMACGQRVDPGRMAADYRVRGGVIDAAIAVLLEHGYLSDCDGRIEAAERQVTTGAYLQQHSCSWELR